MLNELDKLFDMLSEIENKLTDLERINSMVMHVKTGMILNMMFQMS